MNIWGEEAVESGEDRGEEKTRDKAPEEFLTPDS
jgi:hypothetical protein